MGAGILFVAIDIIYLQLVTETVKTINFEQQADIFGRAFGENWGSETGQPYL